MRCVNCNTELESGYMLQLSVGGSIKIVKTGVFKSESCPNVSVCPECGKVELYVDYKSLKK